MFLSKIDREKEGDVDMFYQWHWQESEVVPRAFWFPLLERVNEEPGSWDRLGPLTSSHLLPSRLS